MSFYDLTKKSTLSARDLFSEKHKVKESSLPVIGEKHFQPDGSWLHCKELEVFLDERTVALENPRVEKLKNLFKGVWEPVKKLVNVDKTGKFWSHMGFTDERRNWLYPEEALFLMESNSLEVYDCGLPLSIQEAYEKFLQGGEISLTEYQVFAHLRRLGFVVLRHEERPFLTNYEKQLNLDKYISKRSLKERKEKLMQKKKSIEDAESSQPGSVKVSAEKDASKSSPESSDVRVSSPATSSFNTDENPAVWSEQKTEEFSVAGKRLRSDDENEPESDSCDSSKKVCLNSDVDSFSDNCLDTSGNTKFYSDVWSTCLKQKERDSDNCAEALRQTLWTNELAELPDIAGKDELTLTCPKTSLLPPNVELSEQELIFDVKGYRLKHPLKRDPATHTTKPPNEFSFGEWTKQLRGVHAGSWADYKAKLARRQNDLEVSSPVSHLWDGDVTPLVHPRDGLTYKGILNKIGIIKSVENKDLRPDPEETGFVDLKILYDVHLPNRHNFRKSMPGKPNHRVIVTKTDKEPPGLAEIQKCWHMYKDEVPLHWAVVDNGEIAFYVFDNLRSIKVFV